MKAYKKYLHLANTGAILTEAQIMRGARGILHNLNRTEQGYDAYGEKPEREQRMREARNQFDALLCAFNENPPRPITREHTAKGLAWFAKMHKAGGTWRDTDLTRCFGARQRGIVDAFDHFEWCGFEDIDERNVFLVPVYKVVSTSGESFSYHARSWQSGGGVETF